MELVKPTGERPLGRPRHGWEDNIRMNLKEININTTNWFDSIQDRDLLESPCECGTEPSGFISHGVSLFDFHKSRRSIIARVHVTLP